MTQYLPPNLLSLFAPRDPIPFLAPADKLPHEKKRLPYSGIAGFLQYFEDPVDTPPPVKPESREAKRDRKKRERTELQAYKIEQGIALWDPQNLPKATSDPYKTLFVGRINFDTSESKLRREFEVYGSIRKIYLIYDKFKQKPRGYAFIEFEHERDMHAAYKQADGKKIEGRRVVVDVERGRTVKGWLPRRLGGGLGNTRRAKPPSGVAVVERSRSPESGSRRRSRSRSRHNSRSRSTRRSRSPRRRSRSRSKSPRRRSGAVTGIGDEERHRRRGADDSDRHYKRSRYDDDGGGDVATARRSSRSDFSRDRNDRRDRDRGDVKDRDRSSRRKGEDNDARRNVDYSNGSNWVNKTIKSEVD